MYVNSPSSSRGSLLLQGPFSVLRSFQSVTSLERSSSPNVIFQGGYNDISHGGNNDSEDDDSYEAYVSGRTAAPCGGDGPVRSGNLYVLSRDAPPNGGGVPSSQVQNVGTVSAESAEAPTLHRDRGSRESLQPGGAVDVVASEIQSRLISRTMTETSQMSQEDWD